MGGNDEIKSGPPAGVSNGEKLPSHEALYKEIQAAQIQSSGNTNSGKKFGKIVKGGILILLWVPCAIHVLSIVVGALNLNNCPVERFIPIWLVVAGASGSFPQLYRLSVHIRKRQQQQDAINGENTSSFEKASFFLFTFLNFAWTIAGCVWVYSNYAPETENAAAPGYCDFTTYYLAFWLLTFSFVIWDLLKFFFFFICFCLCVVGAAAYMALEKQIMADTAKDD